MFCKFTGGPLDGMTREIDMDELTQVIVAHGYEPTGPQVDVSRFAPEYKKAFRIARTERYLARQWRDADGRLLCIEYRLEGTA